jgi:hypothetical protein
VFFEQPSVMTLIFFIPYLVSAAKVRNNPGFAACRGGSPCIKRGCSPEAASSFQLN